MTAQRVRSIRDHIGDIWLGTLIDIEEGKLQYVCIRRSRHGERNLEITLRTNGSQVLA